MVVGVMEMHLALYDNGSLKDKRSVVKRVLHRSRNTFNVSGAEVEDQDVTDRAVLGFTAVGSDKRYVEGLLTKLENFVSEMGLADVMEAPRTIEVF